MPRTSVKISHAWAFSDAASATAVVSEPPRPSVVTSISRPIPWKPATTTTRPAASSRSMRAGVRPRIRAFAWRWSVRIPAWKPSSETAGTPSSVSAIDISGADTPSPVESSRSSSRAVGSFATREARSSSRSVESPMALTTTTTSYPARWLAATRRAARLIRAGELSEVPPNFWTRIGRVTDSGRAANIAFARQPFRQQNRPLAGAKLGVVGEHDVLDPFQNRVVTHAADADRHPFAGIAVTARLWPEGVRIDAQQAVGRRRQAFQSIVAEGVHRRRRRSGIRGAFGPDEDRFEVTIADIDPGAGAGDGERRRLAPVTEDLPGLALDLLFLAGDEGDNVVDHVEREHAALAPGTRHRLQRGHHHGADAEGILQRLQRDHQSGRRAVRDRRDEASPVALAPLVVERFGMGVVDAGDEDGNVRLIPEGRRRTDDWDPFRKARLPFLGDLFRDGAEKEVEWMGEQLLI